MTIRALVAKVGFDGHDRGLKIVARILRDAGIEVVYAGLRQTPEGIANIALEESADVIGISMHNGAHLTVTSAVVEALDRKGLATPLVVGGIIPIADVPLVESAGAAEVLGPGASHDEVVAAVTRAASCRRAGSRHAC